MAIDDWPLDHQASRPVGGAPPPGPARPSATRWLIAGATVVIAGALITFWWLNRAQPTPAAPAPTTATDVAVKSNRPKPEAIDLPPLDQSDTLLRDLVATLSRHPMVVRLVATPGLLRGTAHTLVLVGDGKTPVSPLKVLRPNTRAEITGAAAGTLNPQSYARWDAAASALASVNPADAAKLYVTVKPLVDQALRELGQEGDFDDAFLRAARMLATTPNVAGDPRLLRRPNYFEHEDPALRALKPVQKQFLMMGPTNRQRILSWLRALAAQLDLKID